MADCTKGLKDKYVTFGQLRDIVLRKNSLQVNGPSQRSFSVTLVKSRHRCTLPRRSVSFSILHSVPILTLPVHHSPCTTPSPTVPPARQYLLSASAFLHPPPLISLHPSQAEKDLKLLSSDRAQFLSDYLSRKATAEKHTQIMAERSSATSAELESALRTFQPWSERFTESVPPFHSIRIISNRHFSTLHSLVIFPHDSSCILLYVAEPRLTLTLIFFYHMTLTDPSATCWSKFFYTAKTVTFGPPDQGTSRYRRILCIYWVSDLPPHLPSAFHFTYGR